MSGIARGVPAPPAVAANSVAANSVAANSVAANSVAANSVANRPDDFSVELIWRSPPLPSPHGWCMQTRIDADLSGTLQLAVDGGLLHAATWVEPFALFATHLDWLYGALRHHELFMLDWQERRDVPVGGGNETLVVLAHGRETSLPAFVIDEQEAAARACRDAVKALVPQALRDALDGRRKQYVRARL